MRLKCEPSSMEELGVVDAKHVQDDPLMATYRCGWFPLEL